MPVDVDPTTEELRRVFELQRAAFARERYPTLATRRDRLARLFNIVTVHEKVLCAAIDRDFGHRSSQETRLAELYIVAAEIRHAMRHLRRWMGAGSRSRGGGKFDAGDARAWRQVAGTLRSRCRFRFGCAPSRCRQTAQCGTNVHRARLCARARGTCRCVRCRRLDCCATALPVI